MWIALGTLRVPNGVAGVASRIAAIPNPHRLENLTVIKIAIVGIVLVTVHCRLRRMGALGRTHSRIFGLKNFQSSEA
ncbi:MAG: hypothetical protein KF851_20120 [Pirellulaceae bacterium]|nr:hypothetical protein [Pirellulaceae bacterium]